MISFWWIPGVILKPGGDAPILENKFSDKFEGETGFVALGQPSTFVPELPMEDANLKAWHIVRDLTFDPGAIVRWKKQRIVELERQLKLANDIIDNAPWYNADVSKAAASLEVTRAYMRRQELRAELRKLKERR